MQRFSSALVALLALLVCSSATASEEVRPLKPPVAKKMARETVVHGEALRDDYFWLREKESPEVRAYLEAENAYTRARMQPTEALQETLYREMVGRIQETDRTVPYRLGDYLYYSRTEAGKQYSIHCRKRGSLDADEEVTLDLNELAKGHPFMALGTYAVSDDGQRLAYTLDTTGFRDYTLYVKDLRTGELLPERVERVTTAAWAADHCTLFYVTTDPAKRPFRLWRHALGEADNALLHEERDERFRVRIRRSRSRAFLFAEVASLTASESRFLPADQPEGEFRLVAPREPDHEYEVDHRGDRLYLRTNSGGRNFRVVTAPLADPRRENWQELVPHRAETMVESVELFADHAVLREREAGLQQIRILDLKAGGEHHIAFSEPVYALGPEANPEFKTDRYRFTYQSLTTAPSVFDYEMDRRDRELLKREPVLGGYDPENYRSERLLATAPDGTQVPVSLVYRKGTARDGRNPLWLTGYGAYGYSLTPAFSAPRISLLDRGVVFAIAQIRGGGEFGKRWHDDGRMLRKRNTFTDFIACADHLVSEKWTRPDRLAIQGGSAGGLLIGAVVNMRPELCRAAILDVPFVDVINTMLDSSLPLTVAEFEEWGNPQIEEQYRYIRSYDPYTNLQTARYPALLAKTSLNDSQVMYWEPAKYTAKWRALNGDDGLMLLKTNMAGGHGGSSGRYDRLKETAFDYAFVLTQLGVVGRKEA